MKMHQINTLGPTTDDNKNINIPQDIKGTDNLSPSQQQEIASLITNSMDVFSTIPGVADLPPYKLDTGDTPPISRKPYRPSLQWKTKLEQEIQSLLDHGIIRHSTSPWSSPIMPVPKKNGDVRLCVDFRALNKVTAPDNYPLPRIDDLLATVSKAKYLTTLDLTKGYHQIALEPSTILRKI